MEGLEDRSSRRDPGDEFAVLGRLQHLFSGEAGPEGLRLPKAGEVYSGDDAAVLEPPTGLLMLAMDLVVESVHFDLGLGSITDAGWKAISVNVSDIAAMGGRPLHAVVGVSGPRGTDLDALASGLAEAAREYSVGVVGGDLTTGEKLVVSVALTGSCAGAPVLRSGAGAGDLIYLTGPLGASAAGLARLQAAAAAGASVAEEDDVAAGIIAAYRRPLARVDEGCLAASLGATAMIDVSDGLAQDLDHIASDSGVGIRLSGVPVAAGASLQQALGGGEDYELAFTVAPGVTVDEAFSAAGLRAPIRIGVCVSDAAERSLGGEPLRIVGWSHSFG